MSVTFHGIIPGTPATTLFVATLLAASNGLAQTAATLANPRPTSPPPPAITPPPPPPVEAPGLPLVPQIADQVGALLEDASRSAKDAFRNALKTAHSSLMWEAESPAFQFGAGARSSSRSLVIQSTSANQDHVEDLEEDLSVMARILQKAARSLREDDRVNAMGIDVDSSVFGSASGARNLYIQGHGALFLLSVKYPLVGPADPAANERPNPAPDTEWERAREEVLSHSGSGEHESITIIRSSRGKAEPFDERKVAGLKLALLNALTNASNIRHLGPTESVTVVIQGGDTTDFLSLPVASSSRTEGKPRKESKSSSESSKRPAPKGESVMTMRVKKSDLDTLAAGTITAEQFRQKASVLTYLRRTEANRPGRR